MFEGYAKAPLVNSAYVVSPDCYVGTTGVLAPQAERRPLQVFPNPASVRTEVAFQSDKAFEGSLSLHSLGGALISDRPVQIQSGNNLFFLNVQSLPAGNYFVRLHNFETGLAEVVKLQVTK